MNPSGLDYECSFKLKFLRCYTLTRETISGGKRQPPMLPELSIMLPKLSITRLSVSCPKPFPETEKHTNNVRQNCGTHTHTHACTHTHTHIHTHTHTHMCASTSPNTNYTTFTQQQNKEIGQKRQKHANVSKFDSGTTILQQCTM